MRFPWLSGLVTAVILVAMLTPADAIPDTSFNGADVLVHVVTFAVWGFVVRHETAAASGTVLAGGVALALATELLQMLIPGRMFAVWDIVSDVAGLAVGIVVAGWWASRRSQESSANSVRAAGESHAKAD